MKRSSVLFFLLVFFLLSMTISFSQEVSEKKDISVFNLSYYDWDIPDFALGSIDSEIRSVFINIGRFRVLEVRKNFANDGDLQDFIRSLRQIKEKQVEIPEEVSYGHVLFTEADFEALVSSFIVIVPEVTYFNVEVKEDDEGEVTGYSTELKTSYSILDASTMEVVAKPSVESSGYDENERASIQDAITSIKSKLTFKIKSVPLFTLKTGVLVVYSGGITLEKGKNMGILPGYEFEIISSETIKPGLNRERHSGLVLVNSVSEEVSEATVLYGRPQEGDQLKEVPRVGVDGSVYVHAMIENFETNDLIFTAGIKGTLALAVYFIRPIIGLEIPIAPIVANEDLNDIILLVYGFPLNIYLGAELNWYFGRLQVSPTLVAGVGIIAPYDDENEPALTNVGGKAYLALNYLVTRDVKISVDLGYAYWMNVSDLFLPYGGILAGANVVFKM